MITLETGTTMWLLAIFTLIATALYPVKKEFRPQLRMVAKYEVKCAPKVEKILIVSVTADGTGVADFKAAAAKLAAHGGGILNIRRGNYKLASSELASPIVLSNNVRVEGNGSTLTVTGTTITGSIFAAVNASNVVIRHLSAIGNGRALKSGAATGEFFAYVQDNLGLCAQNILIEQVKLQNFAGERWISILNTNTIGKVVRNVRFLDVSSISRPGNSIGPANIATGAGVISVFGVGAPIADVLISGFYAGATNIKQGITIFHRVSNVRIVKPVIVGAGQDGATDDAGAYAINVYGDPGEMSNVTIDNPVIIRPRSAGIYLRGVNFATVNNAVISGQTDVMAGTLPKGAIATNGATRVRVNGGKLSGNAYDISVAANPTNATLDFKAQHLTTRGATSASIVVNPGGGTGFAQGFELDDCDIQAKGMALRIFNAISGTRYLRSLHLRRDVFASTTSRAIELDTYGPSEIADYLLQDLKIRSAEIGVHAVGLRGDLQMTDVKIENANRSQASGRSKP